MNYLNSFFNYFFCQKIDSDDEEESDDEKKKKKKQKLKGKEEEEEEEEEETLQTNSLSKIAHNKEISLLKVKKYSKHTQTPSSPEKEKEKGKEKRKEGLQKKKKKPLEIREYNDINIMIVDDVQLCRKIIYFFLQKINPNFGIYTSKSSKIALRLFKSKFYKLNKHLFKDRKKYREKYKMKYKTKDKNDKDSTDEPDTESESEDEDIDKNTKFQSPFDIIFMDVIMPVMRGDECSNKIRKFEKKYHLNKCKIVAVSGKDSADVDMRNMDGFLQKPFQMENILAFLKEYSK